MNTKARRVTRYVIKVNHPNERYWTEVFVTRKQLDHINAVPVGKPFFMSRWYCMENSDRDQSGDHVRHADGTLWRVPLKHELVDSKPLTDRVQ